MRYLTGLMLFGLCSTANADSGAWRVLNSSSNVLSRIVMGDYSTEFGCNKQIANMSGEVFTSKCYDLGREVFVVHQTVDDTCDIIFPDIGNLPETLRIESLPRCSEKNLFQDVGMFRKDPYDVLKTNYLNFC